MPIPWSMGIFPSAERLSLNTLRSVIMRMAARTARSGSSSCGTGVPKIHIIASPMNLSSIPPSSVMQSTMIVKYSFSSFTVPWAPSSSVIVVKHLTSEKRTVPTLCFPPIISSLSPAAMSWSANSGSIYLDIVDFILFSELISSIISMFPRVSIFWPEI